MQETKTKEFKLGRIKYRTLNVPGRMRLLAALGITADKDSGKKLAKLNPLLHLANVIEAMGPQIVEIDAKKGGKEITTFEEAMDHEEFVEPLAAIGSELLNQLTSTVAGAAGGKRSPARRKSGKKRKR